MKNRPCHLTLMFAIAATVYLAFAGVLTIGDSRGANTARAAPLQTPPTPTLVDPASASNDLDTRVLITGSNFIATPFVLIGNTPLNDVIWVSATLLEATVPWGLAPGVYDLTVENPGGESGTLAQAFTVTEGIGVWNATALYGGSVGELAINPLTPTVLYAASENVGLFRTTDGAGHWSFIASATAVRHLALVPAAPDTLYLAMTRRISFGLHRSDDGGDTWTPLDAPGDRPYPHPTDPDVVYVAQDGSSGGLWRSDNRGLDWVTVTTGLTDTHLTALAFHPTHPLTMAVGTGNGNIFLSTDGGASWSHVAQPLDAVATLAFNPRGDHELWASTICFSSDSKTLRSTDAGYTAWAPVADPVGSAPMPTIAFPPAAWDSVAYSRTVFVNGCWGDAYRSDDDGASWSPYGPQTGDWALALHPSLDTHAYRSSASDAVVATSDGGTTWYVANQGLTAVVPRQLEVVPGRADQLYALTEREDGLYRGTQGGAVWQFLTVAGEWGISTVLADPVTPTRVYAGRGDPADRILVQISPDAGETWPVTSEIPVSGYTDCPNFANALAAHASQPGVVLLGAEHFCFGMPGVHTGDLYYSSDAGLTWTPATISGMSTISPVTAIAHDLLTPTIVYASTGIWDMGSGLLRSTDGGQTWARVGASVSALDVVFDLAVEQSAPHRVFALTNADGIYVSADHGLTWAQAADPFLGSQVEQLLCTAEDPSVVYAAVSQSWRGPGLYRSRDGAQTWERVPGALGSLPIYALDAATAEDRVFLYAGTTGGTVAAPATRAQAADASTLVSAGVYRFAQRTWRVCLPVVLSSYTP